jgi:hypothetical protein
MDFLVGFLIYVVGAIVGIVFMVFAPSEIRKKITDALNPNAKEKSDEKIVSTTSSSSSYFDKGSGSSFLISSSSNL